MTRRRSSRSRKAFRQARRKSQQRRRRGSSAQQEEQELGRRHEVHDVAAGNYYGRGDPRADVASKELADKDKSRDGGRKAQLHKVLDEVRRATRKDETLTAEQTRRKVAAIEVAVERLDVEALALLAMGSGGLVSDSLRRRAWPLLLRNESFKMQDAAGHHPVRRSRKAIISTFQMDIDRSLFHFTCDKAMSARLREAKRGELKSVLATVLQREPQMHYYQGMHDVGTVILHVSGSNVRWAADTLQLMCQQYLCDHTRSDFKTTMRVMDLLPELVRFYDPEVYQVLKQTQVGSMFGLSWLITVFAHSIADIDVVIRLFDAVLATHPAFVVYLCGAMLLRREIRREILALARSPDCDMAEMHHFLQNMAPPRLPSKRGERHKHGDNVDRFLFHAMRMMSGLPPDELVRLADDALGVRVPACSVVRVSSERKAVWTVVNNEFSPQRKSSSLVTALPRLAMATALAAVAVAWAIQQQHL